MRPPRSRSAQSPCLEARARNLLTHCPGDGKPRAWLGRGPRDLRSTAHRPPSLDYGQAVYLGCSSHLLRSASSRPRSKVTCTRVTPQLPPLGLLLKRCLDPQRHPQSWKESGPTHPAGWSRILRVIPHHAGPTVAQGGARSRFQSADVTGSLKRPRCKGAPP